jgi:hypothetical protein
MTARRLIAELMNAALPVITPSPPGFTAQAAAAR